MHPCRNPFLSPSTASPCIRSSAAFLKTVKDEKGELCQTQDECHKRWKTHFQRILNIENDFDTSVIEAVRQRGLRTELDIAPTPEELEVVLQALKSGKAGERMG